MGAFSTDEGGEVGVEDADRVGRLNMRNVIQASDSISLACSFEH